MVGHLLTLLRVDRRRPVARTSWSCLCSRTSERARILGDWAGGSARVRRRRDACIAASRHRSRGRPTPRPSSFDGTALRYRGAERTSQPARPPAAAARRRARRPRRPLRRALAGAGRRHPRDPEGGRRLPAARSRVSAGSARSSCSRTPGVAVVVGAGASSCTSLPRHDADGRPSRHRRRRDRARERRKSRRAVPVRTTSPTSSTRRARPASRRACRSRTPTWRGCSTRPTPGSASDRATCGRCSTRSPSTSPCGSSGARCCTAAAWWSCPTGSAARRRRSTSCSCERGRHGPQPDAVGVPAADPGRPGVGRGARAAERCGT